MPWHKGILAVDVPSGKVMWENTQLTFAGVRDELLIAYEGHPGQERFVILDPVNGREVERSEANITGAPVSLHPAGALFPETREMSGSDIPLPGNTTGSIESIGVDGYGIVSFLTPESHSGEENPLFRQHLVVARVADGESLYSDVMTKRSSGFLRDAFFVQEGFVYYLKEGMTLNALHLSSI